MHFCQVPDGDKPIDKAKITEITMCLPWFHNARRYNFMSIAYPRLSPSILVLTLVRPPCATNRRTKEVFFRRKHVTKEIVPLEERLLSR